MFKLEVHFWINEKLIISSIVWALKSLDQGSIDLLAKRHIYFQFRKAVLLLQVCIHSEKKPRPRLVSSSFWVLRMICS